VYSANSRSDRFAVKSFAKRKNLIGNTIKLKRANIEWKCWLYPDVISQRETVEVIRRRSLILSRVSVTKLNFADLELEIRGSWPGRWAG